VPVRRPTRVQRDDAARLDRPLPRQLAATLGRYDDAERHFAHAATTHAELEAPGFLARTNCDWALALLERGGPGDGERAQRMLDDATAAAREIGAAGIERRAAEATAGAR
jgi:hypothetical protein